MEITTDYLIIGSGLAGLSLALKLADHGSVILITKEQASATNTAMAQGGIAAVFGPEDSFEDHILDTLTAGAGLCHSDIVRNIVEQAPARIQELIAAGVKFDASDSATGKQIDLGREGGHSFRRILHVQDHTGAEIHKVLLAKTLAHPRIQIIENSYTIDLITNHKNDSSQIAPLSCHGAYSLNLKTGTVDTYLARATVLAAGGAGRVYQYSSNWSGATGDGVAIGYRAGARVANMEFMQFHPTCLYHPKTRNFLITEALRGEGAELVDSRGTAFMEKYHPMKSLAPRDIVARSIDAEMKKSGEPCVFLDITHHPESFLRERFPVIFNTCLDLGINMATDPIPVVPAAHYLCGGVLTDIFGRTDVRGLFAVGENACTGLHGANRLASNSLLECLAVSHNLADWVKNNPSHLPEFPLSVRPWVETKTENEDELAVIHHMWDEIRSLMWNYVGIVRTDRRLFRAQSRLNNIMNEVREYYWNFKLHPSILELRNIALVASLTVACALQRKESRGIHYNLDYPKETLDPQDSVIAPGQL
jgi:L-aspartate oxidase